jgi:hypothetical protein
MSYVIELQMPASPVTYVLAQAASRDDARALVDVQLSRDEAFEDVVIVAVHAIH